MRLANGMEFENDEAVIGRWRYLGRSDEPACRRIDGLRQESVGIDELYFLPEGEGYWVFEGWTRGCLLIHYGGDEPILSCPYEIAELAGKTCLFIHQEDGTSVFVKADGRRYQKAALGRHDNIDLPFIDDARVHGVWHSVGFVERIEDFDPGGAAEDYCLTSMEFRDGGLLLQRYMDELWQNRWTRGLVLSVRRETAAPYVIRELDGAAYLFMEWRMGDYIYGGCEPDYYVFAREESAYERSAQ